MDARTAELPNLTVVGHPLVASKMARLRDKATGDAEFRKLVRELAGRTGPWGTSWACSRSAVAAA